jgi:hypothetical protein
LWLDQPQISDHENCEAKFPVRLKPAVEDAMKKQAQ